MKGRVTRRWWMLALLVVGAAAAASGAAGTTTAGGHGFVAQLAADATISTAAVQAAVLPWRGEEGQSSVIRAVAEPAPTSLAALLAAMSLVPGMAALRARRRHEGPISTVVALRRAVALRAPPRLRLA